MHRIIVKSFAKPDEIAFKMEDKSEYSLAVNFLAVAKVWGWELGGYGLWEVNNLWPNISVRSWKIGTSRQFELGTTGWMTFIRDADKIDAEAKRLAEAETLEQIEDAGNGLDDDQLEYLLRGARG